MVKIPENAPNDEFVDDTEDKNEMDEFISSMMDVDTDLPGDDKGETESTETAETSETSEELLAEEPSKDEEDDKDSTKGDAVTDEDLQKVLSGEIKTDVSKDISEDDVKIIDKLQEDLDETFRKIEGVKTPKEGSTESEEVPKETEKDTELEGKVSYPRFTMDANAVKALDDDPEKAFPRLAENIAASAVDATLKYIKENPAEFQTTEANIREVVSGTFRDYQNQQRYLVNLAESYKRQYPEHVAIMGTVGQITEIVAKENPDKAPHTLLKEVARRTDELVEAARQGKLSKGSPKTGMSTTPGVRTSQSNGATMSQEQDVAELLDF